MILYFTGTGTSRYVAEQIARKTGDELVSINSILKENTKEILTSERCPFVFVLPTYAWRIPRIIEDFIRENTFSGCHKVYFIMTCGENTSKAIDYIKRLCQEKKWELLGFAEVIMPDNWIVLSPALDRAKAEKIIRQASPRIRQIAEHIHENKHFLILAPSGLMGRLKSGPVNPAFYKILVSAKGFRVTKKCSGCKKCSRACPLNNIKMEGGKPVWGSRCTHCMACIQGCPQTAVEYKNSTRNKPRFFVEENTTF